MKQIHFLFSISVRRAEVLSVIRQLIVCLLISLGTLSIMGCGHWKDLITDSDRDLTDLSQETLDLSLLPIEQLDLCVGEGIKLEAAVEYSGDDTELRYHWTSTAGTIYGTGQQVIYVAPKETGTCTIICRVSNGVKTVSDFRMAKVD